MNHPFLSFNDTYDHGLILSGMADSALRRPRFFNLIQLLHLTDHLGGLTAEVGCFKGLSSYLICKTLSELCEDYDGSSHFIFDSYEGLSTPTSQDTDLSIDCTGRFSDTSIEHVKNTLREFPKVSICKGWVPEVFAGLSEQRYKFVHIDVDLYQPTFDSLLYFYPRLSSNGIIIIDDFTPWPQGGKYIGCAKAVIDFCRTYNVSFASLASGNALIINH